MSRFTKELAGEYGPYWKSEAEKTLQKVDEQIQNGEITIDEFGVARNCIGRVVSEDIAEQIFLLNHWEIDLEMTSKMYEIEVAKELEKYRKSMQNYVPSAEEISEMQNEFDKGTTVINVITGQKIML